MASSEVLQLSTIIDEVLEPLLKDHASYALLDFPDHMNVGDSCIYAGELTYLDRRFGAPAKHVAALYHPIDPIAALPEDTVVLLHGGGNFGDVWERHQLYREAVLEAYPDRKIIQMPQSIHFSDVAARDRVARAIAGHPNFTLLVRDHPSFELAEAHFDCQTLMCPDMAYGLAPVTPPSVPKLYETLCLMRQDHERDASAVDMSDLGHVADWPNEFSTAERMARFAFKAGTRATRGNIQMLIRERHFRFQAQSLTQKGFNMFAAADRIVTDRLHGHIMSSLLGKPHVVLDNFYGKVRNFINAWPKDPYARCVDGPAEVRAALDSL